MGIYSKDQLRQLVIDYAYGLGVPPSIALEQIKRESADFKESVVYGPFVGAAGERGMSQFTPATWDRFGNGPHTNAYDPDLAMTAWFNYMQFLLNLFDWDIEKALIAYNGGEGHLTNPGRFGPPSAAAQRYAREILAKAGQTPDIYTVDNSPSPRPPDPQESPILTYALIGAVAFVILLLVRD